jgi:hypothetical protein
LLQISNDVVHHRVITGLHCTVDFVVVVVIYVRVHLFVVVFLL